MRLARFALVFAGSLGAALGQQAQPAPPPNRPPVQRPPEARPVREMRHRLMLIATRAVGYFMSADSIEARLREEGLSLHPDIIVLRVRLKATLDEANAAIDQGDLAWAAEALDAAQALLDRFAAKLGG